MFANLLNAMNEVYAQDAVDNSGFNGFAPLQHRADDAEVFLCLPRKFNIGFEVVFQAISTSAPRTPCSMHG